MSCLMSAGLTPLHTAVMSHNAVVRQRRIIKNLCLYRKTELAKKRWMYVQCVKILLLMGASFGTKVWKVLEFGIISEITEPKDQEINLSAGSEERTDVRSHGFGGGQRWAVTYFPPAVVVALGHQCQGGLSGHHEVFKKKKSSGTDSTHFVSDVQWKYGPARRQRSAEPQESSGSCEAAVDEGSGPQRQEPGERAAISAAAWRAHCWKGKVTFTRQN